MCSKLLFHGSYLDGGSKVYGCLVDASKAFDTVDHTILLDKLLSRGLPNAMVSRRNATFRSKVGETGVGETGVGEPGISHWVPSRYSRICGDHFVSGKLTRSHS